MNNILVVGGGKIGSVVAALLAGAHGEVRYQVTVADRSAAQLEVQQRSRALELGLGLQDSGCSG